MKTLLILLPLVSVMAAEIRFEGVLANSGPLDQPVQAGTVGTRCVGIGVAFDEPSGRLFTRIGNDRLAAYSIDGRCVGSWKLPASENEWDRMVLCGNTLVFLINQTLYRLPISAPDGTTAEKIECSAVKPTTLSASAKDGKVIVWQKEGGLLSLDPVSGKTEPFGELKGNFWMVDGMDWGEDGNLYIVTGRDVHQFVNGKETFDARFPKRFIGSREAGATRPKRLGRYWFGSAWHGTVKRFTADFEPSPGVVLGGASGHFIGHVICNYELDVALGFAEIAPGIYALGAFNGTIQIAKWDSEEKKLELIRRIGPLPQTTGLAVSSDGRIFAHQNVWRWNDGPLSPAEFGVPATAVTPAALMTPDAPVMLSAQWGKTGAIFGRLEDGQLRTFRGDSDPKRGEAFVGLLYCRALPNKQGKELLLAVKPTGECERFELSGDPRNIAPKSVGTSRLKFSSEGVVTSAVMKDPDTVFAVQKGEIVELVRDGNDWREKSRPLPQKFSGPVRLAVSGDRVIVAETDSGVVSLFDFAAHRKLAQIQSSSPDVIAANGPFLVVYDKAGQRILKYRIVD